MRAFRLPPILQHLLFWLLFCLFVSARDLVYHPYLADTFLTNVILYIPIAPLVYFNLYFLIPKLLLRKRTFLYVLSVIALLVFSTLLSREMYRVLFSSYGLLERVEFFTSIRGQIVIFTEMLLLTFVSMALFFIQQWYVKDRYAQELERKNLEGEIRWLRHQIQPHFLFNTLNAIYLLMERKSELAQRVLLRFSEMLSHQLYDARKDRISLEKELHYLENYLQIEALRNEDLLTLTYDLPQKAEGYELAPMLLIPFVENAFKHGRSAQGYWVKLHIQIHAGRLDMQVSNSVSQAGAPSHTPASGIGLANVRRRLALIYPQTHTLNIEEGVDTFLIHLSLPLEESETPTSPASSLSTTLSQ